MNKYRFTLYIEGVTMSGQAFEDLFFASGHSDAFIDYTEAVGMSAEFNREESSYAIAMLSAIQDIENAHPDAKVVKVVFRHGEMSGPMLKDIIASCVIARPQTDEGGKCLL